MLLCDVFFHVIRPVLKHGPRSLTYVRVKGLLSKPVDIANAKKSEILFLLGLISFIFKQSYASPSLYKIPIIGHC